MVVTRANALELGVQMKVATIFVRIIYIIVSKAPLVQPYSSDFLLIDHVYEQVSYRERSLAAVYTHVYIDLKIDHLL